MQNTPYLISPATLEDVEEITVCVDQAYRHYIPRLGKKPGPMLEDYVVAIAEHEVYVATGNRVDQPSAIVGVLLLKSYPDMFLLDNVAVAPATQGTGLGRLLVTFAEERARTLGYEHVELSTHETLTENLEMYPKLGYEEVRRVSEKGFDRVYFSKAV